MANINAANKYTAAHKSTNTGVIRATILKVTRKRREYVQYAHDV